MYGNMYGGFSGNPWQTSILDAQNKELQNQLLKIEKENMTKPQARAWDNQLGSDGLMKGSLKLNNNLNEDALNALRQEGMREAGTPSAWRGLMDEKITNQAAQSSTDVQAQQQRQLDNMAMRGGVGQGAIERMGARGVQQNLSNQQNIFGNRLNADFQDEQNRQGALNGLVNAEFQAGSMQNDIDAKNLDAASQERFQKRAFDTNVYNEKMRAWAAERTAEATPSGGGKK